MLSQEKLWEHIPEDGTSEGPACVFFREPDGSVSGKGTIRLSSDGRVSVRIDVEQYSIPPEYRNLLVAFLRGARGQSVGAGGISFQIGGTERIGTLQVQTDAGCFRAARALVSGGRFDLSTSENSWFELVPYGLEFVTDDAVAEEIWCTPLFGKISEFKRCANACLVNGQTPYIHFRSDGLDCGLLIPASADASSHKAFDAVAFGQIGDRPHLNAEELGYLVPWGLYAAMEFAFGSYVRAPWIELRDRAGALKRRVHLRLGATGDGDEDGSAAFSLFDSGKANSGVAEFLRLFFELSPEHRRAITPTLSLIHRGKPGSATVDESITNLVKALDATCKRHGFSRVNLAAKLDSATSENVRQVVIEAREQLKKIRRKCKDDQKLDQLGVLDRIVSRQANVSNDELDFGIAVSGLLNRFGLRDCDVMEAYYSKLPLDATWAGLLSFIRGEVVHSGAIHVENRAEIVSWFELARHLHDICKRLILREVGYSGTYAPSNVLFSGTYELDRVTPSATTAQLGYTVPPTPI